MLNESRGTISVFFVFYLRRGALRLTSGSSNLPWQCETGESVVMMGGYWGRGLRAMDALFDAGLRYVSDESGQRGYW